MDVFIGVRWWQSVWFNEGFPMIFRHFSYFSHRWIFEATPSFHSLAHVNGHVQAESLGWLTWWMSVGRSCLRINEAAGHGSKSAGVLVWPFLWINGGIANIVVNFIVILDGENEVMNPGTLILDWYRSNQIDLALRIFGSIVGDARVFRFLGTRRMARRIMMRMTRKYKLG